MIRCIVAGGAVAPSWMLAVIAVVCMAGERLVAQLPMPAQKPVPPVAEQQLPPPRPEATPSGIPGSSLPPNGEIPLSGFSTGTGIASDLGPYRGTATVFEDRRKTHLFDKPLPGTLEDGISRDYAGREGFRFYWNGGTTTLFPTQLFWEPPLAIVREPRLGLATSSDTSFQAFNTVDSSLGVIPGLIRFEPPGSDLAMQVDLFGVVHTRWDGNDDLASSYRFGVPVTFRRGNWQAKIAYERTIDTIGDRLQYSGVGRLPQPAFARFPRLPTPRWSRDEVVIGLGHTVEEQVRIYGQVAYAARFDWPDPDSDRSRFDLGFEWYHRLPTGWQGTPFLAGNLHYDGATNYEAGYTIQAGWLWRNPELRLAQGRVFLQYANTRSPFAAFSVQREESVAFGIAADY